MLLWSNYHLQHVRTQKDQALQPWETEVPLMCWTWPCPPVLGVHATPSSLPADRATVSLSSQLSSSSSALGYSFLLRNSQVDTPVPLHSKLLVHQTHFSEFVHFSLHSLHSPVCFLKAKRGASCIALLQVPGAVPWIKWA